MGARKAGLTIPELYELSRLPLQYWLHWKGAHPGPSSEPRLPSLLVSSFWSSLPTSEEEYSSRFSIIQRIWFPGLFNPICASGYPREAI